MNSATLQTTPPPRSLLTDKLALADYFDGLDNAERHEKPKTSGKRKIKHLSPTAKQIALRKGYR